MSFFYTREAGPEGQIITGEDQAPGVDLATLVEAAPLPIRAALEMVAGLADIITIADEDRAVHGDLNLNDIRVQADGAVTITGYGVPRRAGRAPESKPAGVATDVYGLAALLLTSLTGQSLGPVPRDRDGHDEAIVQMLITVDWGQIAGKRWLEDLQRFLCAMFAWTPEERPAPLDVANVLMHVAGQSGGDDLTAWAARAVRAAGGTSGKKAAGTVVPQEDLGGPQNLGAPMSATSAFKIRQAASAKGESTAFWSRDRIAAMLAEEDEEDLARPVRQTWSPDAAKRTTGSFNKPETVEPRAATTTRPQQGPSGVAPPPPSPPWRPQGASGVSAPPPNLPPNPPPSSLAGMGAPAQMPPPIAPPVSKQPVAGPPVPPPNAGALNPPIAQQRPMIAAGPIAQGPIMQPPPVMDDAPTEGGRQGMLKWVAIGAALIAVICLGGGGTAAWYFFGREAPVEEAPPVEAPTKEPTTTAEPVTPPPAPSAGPSTPDTGAAPKPETTAPTTSEPTTTTTAPATTTTAPATTTTAPATTTKSSSSTSTKSSGSTSTKSSGSTSTKSSGSTSTKSSGSSTKSSGSSTKSTKSTTATGGGGPYNVKFTAPGDAVLQCGDGQQISFAMSTRVTFSDITTCRVKMGPALGVVQISRSGSFSCTADASNVVTCTGS